MYLWITRQLSEEHLRCSVVLVEATLFAVHETFRFVANAGCCSEANLYT